MTTEERRLENCHAAAERLHSVIWGDRIFMNVAMDDLIFGVEIKRRVLFLEKTLAAALKMRINMSFLLGKTQEKSSETARLRKGFDFKGAELWSREFKKST